MNRASTGRKYFAQVPHFVLDHSTGIDQALYAQMKRYAGERPDGVCWASKRTLMKKLKIGVVALNASIAHLVAKGWIVHSGKRKVLTQGGEQEVDSYSIVDIWQQNIAFYEGAAETTPLSDEGVAENKQGVLENSQGVAEPAPNKSPIRKEEKDPIDIFPLLKTQKEEAGMPVNEAIALFRELLPGEFAGRNTAFVKKPTREVVASLLETRSLDQLKVMIDEYGKRRNEQFAPSVGTIYEFCTSKLAKIETFLAREQTIASGSGRIDIYTNLKEIYDGLPMERIVAHEGYDSAFTLERLLALEARQLILLIDHSNVSVENIFKQAIAAVRWAKENQAKSDVTADPLRFMLAWLIHARDGNRLDYWRDQFDELFTVGEWPRTQYFDKGKTVVVTPQNYMNYEKIKTVAIISYDGGKRREVTLTAEQYEKRLRAEYKVKTDIGVARALQEEMEEMSKQSAL